MILKTSEQKCNNSSWFWKHYCSKRILDKKILKNYKICEIEKKTLPLKKRWIDVLLKLTKTTINGIEAFESDGKYTFNVSVEELTRAVNTTLLNHNISLLAN